MARSRLLQLLLAAVFASAFVTPFGRELFVGDETKYSMVVREMRATGNVFLPTLEGTPFTHKPPLHFWLLDLLSYALGTHSIWTFVIPSLAFFALLLWLLWRMGGPLAAFVCGTSLMVWGSAQTARMDLAFTALITLAAWMLERFFATGERRSLTFAGVALGIATLFKGPMAAVIAIVLFGLEWWRRRAVPRANYAPAIAAMAVIPLLWFVPAMLMGGGRYTHEVLQKQLAGRAVSSWVHSSPPWYYLTHAPAYLLPWFLLAVAALASRWREQRFNVNWILAVLIPYSLMSSKLDVYMMALIPPVALVIADYLEHANAWARRANIATLVLFLALGAAALVVIARIPQLQQSNPKAFAVPEAAYAQMGSVRMLFVVLVLASIVAIVVSARGAIASSIATGLVPVAVLVYAGLAMMPVVNELASTRPLVATLAAQHVAGDRIALFTAPHLWTRDMPPDLERVHYVSPDNAFATDPQVVVTSRKYASQLGPRLSAYRRVAEVRMIGKWFDVYRR